MKKILLIGPLPEPTTGVSLANKVALENLNGFNIDTINTSFNRFDESLGKFSLNKVFFYLKMNFHVLKLFKSDIVYITPGQTFYGVLKYTLFITMSSILRKELIIHVHGNYLGRQYIELKGFKKKIFKWLLKKTNKGIVLSESLKNNMSHFINENRIYVLKNFVEDYLFLNKEEIVQKKNNNELKIVYLSNLMKEKGIYDLLEALLILENEGIKYEAKIAGSIDEANREKLEMYFSKLKNTSYLGVVKGENKKAFLNWSNIFILPTFYTMEGQPISILEAMATGNIVLTTLHAGIPDIFKNGVNGYYINKNDSLDIAKKIKALTFDASLEEIKTNNMQEAEKKYRVKTFSDGLSKVFNS